VMKKKVVLDFPAIFLELQFFVFHFQINREIKSLKNIL